MDWSVWVNSFLQRRKFRELALLGAVKFSSGLGISVVAEQTQAERCYPVEPIVPIACTHNGVYLAGGGLSGKIYLWEVSSWNLLATWAAHYKAVSCLVFSDDDSLLLSGADDGIVSVWPLIRVLDTIESSQATPKVFLYRWAGHRACVTAVLCSAGGANAVVVSSSLDHTCKVWSLALGRLLQSIQLQSAINSIVLDPTEQSLYAGTSDGRIFIRTLNQCLSPVSDVDSDALSSEFIAHRLAVTALAFSIDGRSLVSASEDSSVCVWDIVTGNIVRELHNKGPVTNLLVIPEAHMFGHCKDHEHHLCKGRILPLAFAESIRSPTGSWDFYMNRDPLVLLPTSVPTNGEAREGHSYSASSLDNQIVELQHESTPAALQLKIKMMKAKRARALKTGREYSQQNELLSCLFFEMLHITVEKGL